MHFPSRFLALFSLAPLTVSAVTITIDADVLQDSGGAPMAQTGLVILTAATNGSFNGPSGSNFATGDEMVLYSWDLSAFGMDGVLSDLTDPLSFSGGWNQGDLLRLYWYPTLTLGATGPAAGTPYGFYSDPTGIDGSAAWITPAESDNITLSFFTSDSTLVPGSNDPLAGVARFEVPGGTPVPETGSSFVLMAVGVAGIFIARVCSLRSKLRHA